MNSSTFSRRVPPLVMGALALALMIAILPSSLHLPITGPGSQAEVAPVPGQGKTQANLSQLGLADSGTVGAAGSSALADAGQPTPLAELLQGLAPGTGTVAQQAHCVGSPPRQTEDPLSPPCVASWQGDNGGSTAKGVSSGSITVASVGVYDANTDYSAAVTSKDTAYVRTVKVLLKYFQSRFQTYGRQVHLVGVNGAITEPALQTVDQKYRPFAILEPGATSFDSAIPRMGDESFFAGGIGIDPVSSFPSRQQLQSSAPFGWSLMPQSEDFEASAAHLLCNTLRGHPAVLAHDPTLAARTRRIALVYASNSSTRSDALAAAARQLCGFQFAMVESSGRSESDGSIAAAVARAKADGDTTILCYPCGYVNYFVADATSQQYLPEWIFVGGDMAEPLSAREVDQGQWNDATGLTWKWREPVMPQAYWWQAYTQVDPTGTPDRSVGQVVYQELMQLFGAVQLAGPRLTSASVESGMQSWHRPSTDPSTPSASYDAGSYSFVKDFGWVRWDATGSPPGGVEGNGGAGGGCYRWVDGGARFDSTAHDWPISDDAAARSDWPCGADQYSSTDQTPDTEGASHS
ncbi:MAG: hypothetical protein ACYDGR_14405 [Candidatus Dormibacteria bacterium]